MPYSKNPQICAVICEIVSANYRETKEYKGSGINTANFGNNFN
jgi:hypothetical protein